MYVFFFKHRTSYEWRISDLSSDVCSSALAPLGRESEFPDTAASRCRPIYRWPNLGLPRQFIAYTLMISHDPAKRRTNLAKHNIDLPGCMEAFDGPMLTREDDREDYGEQRLVSLGWAHGRVVVLVWTDREEKPRLKIERASCRERVCQYV